MRVVRARQQTELGEEVQCAKCRDFWPADSEFFYFSGGRPHSWCIDCYRNDRKVKAHSWAAKQGRVATNAQHA